MILWRISSTGKRASLLGVLVVSVWLLAGTLDNGQAASAPATSSTAVKKEIQDAQERLLALGYQSGLTDGVMGAKTAAALKKFQSDHGLPVTGTLDRKTTDALSMGDPAAKSSTPVASPAAPAKANLVDSPMGSSPLKLTVESTEVGARFPAYVGGGANISPPDTLGGGGGIPLISFSNGSSFLAGEVSSKDKNTNFIRVSLAFANPTQDAHSFKIGDVTLVVGKVRMNDFAAVGYGSKLCAMGDTDRKTVKKIVVNVAPGDSANLSYLFALTVANPTQGQVVLGNSVPVTFEIDNSPNK